MFVVGALVWILALSGCGGAQVTEESRDASTIESFQSSDAQSSPPVEEEEVVEAVEEPAPIELTKEEAGTLFLDVICGVNARVGPYNEALEKADNEWAAGANPDMVQINHTAGVYADAILDAITVFDDPSYIWPSDVSTPIRQMRDGFMEYLQPLRDLQNARSYSMLEGIQFPSPAMPSQEIRYELGLPSDPAESCVGHEAKLSGLAEQARERADAQ